MHAVIRTYTGEAAGELIDRIIERQDEVEPLLRGVSGFVSYTIMRTDEGGVSVTVCESKEGTDESSRVARDWVAENGSDLGASPPEVTEGAVGIHLA